MTSLDRIPVPILHASWSLTLTLTLSVVAALAAGPVVAQDDSPPPSVTPSPDEASLSEGFTPEMISKVGEVIEGVHPVRGLSPADEVGYRVIDQATFRAEFEALFREEYTEEYVAAEDDAFTRLGLLDADDDLEELMLSIYDSQVLAFYDPLTADFTLIGPIDDIGALESIVVAHEYGHALQDSEWDLEERRIKDLDRSDAVLAQQALVEGDATAIMYEWAARELGALDLFRVVAQSGAQQELAALEEMPTILRRQLEFPYLDGLEFVTAVRGRAGWDAVDAVWEAQPVSTEQVLHPELYPGELPVEIVLPDVAAAMGPEWTTSYEQTLGEMQIGVWVADGHKTRTLLSILPATLPRAEAAAGWGGDRLVSIDGPDGAWSVIWQTDWDTRSDAQEFQQAAIDAMEDMPGAHHATDADIVGGLSSPVLVLVADSEPTLSAVQSALGF